MRIISLTILLLTTLSSLSQDFELEVSNKVFRNVFTESDESIEWQSSFNINSRITISQNTNFGKVLFGIGYSTFNYLIVINLDEDEPPFDPSFETTRKKNGHRYLVIPLGVQLNINESIYIPIETGLNIELENQTGFYKKQFVSISTGVGFAKTMREKFVIGFEPNISFFIDATQNPQWTSKMPLNYGVRLNLSYKL